MLSGNCPFQCGWKIWAHTSSADRFFINPIAAVAQNVQPRPHPDWEEIHIDVQPCLYLDNTVSIFDFDFVSNKTFSTCSADLITVGFRGSGESPNLSTRLLRRSLGSFSKS